MVISSETFVTFVTFCKHTYEIYTFIISNHKLALGYGN